MQHGGCGLSTAGIVATVRVVATVASRITLLWPSKKVSVYLPAYALREPASSTIATSVSDVSMHSVLVLLGAVCSFTNAINCRFGMSCGAPSFSFTFVVDEKSVMTTGEALAPVFVTSTQAWVGVTVSVSGVLSPGLKAKRKVVPTASPAANSYTGLTDGSRYLSAHDHLQWKSKNNVCNVE